ncbi:hypothetical protein FBT96_00075, partial [Rhodobacter capsulatus]
MREAGLIFPRFGNRERAIFTGPTAAPEPEAPEMAKAKFERNKPHVNIGTIGHVDHGKTTLT